MANENVSLFSHQGCNSHILETRFPRSTPSRLQVSSSLHRNGMPQPVKLIRRLCADLISSSRAAATRHKSLTFMTTLTPQSLQPQVHIALNTNSETP